MKQQLKVTIKANLSELDEKLEHILTLAKELSNALKDLNDFELDVETEILKEDESNQEVNEK